MSARDRVAGPVHAYLLAHALRRGCTVDDLSAGDVFDAEQLALECYRRALDDAADDAPTQPRVVPPGVSQTLPVVGVWEGAAEKVTPVRPPAAVAVPRGAWPYTSR